LERILRERIASSGPISFPEFMAAALYDPEVGYYAAGSSQVGRGGDFFTSVSVGRLFGELLARRFAAWWRADGTPRPWRIVECGAHDGTLAADVLEALGRHEPAAMEQLEYVIPEPLPALRDAQAKTLARWPGTVRLATDAAEIGNPMPGIVFGNEVLDALPFHLVEWRDAWHECRVAAAPAGGFTWAEPVPVAADGRLAEVLRPLGRGFPMGYRAEVRTCFQDFLAPLAAAVSRGLMVWIDYGFARPELYHPARTGGTLRTFSKHRAGEDPLASPGEADITAHVDFTAVAEVSAALGCPPVRFRSQGHWLTEAARGWLAEQEGAVDAKLLRQFQSLTHPGHLGARFHVLECAVHAPQTTAPAEAARLALVSDRADAGR